MNKVLCVDIGNTNTKFALVADGFYEYLGHIATVTANDVGSDFLDIKSEIVDCIISSVAPSKTQDVANIVRYNFGVEPKFVPEDRGVGADLLASMKYAKKHFKLPCCVFSLGTATTMFVLDENGRMQGGIICPGIEPSLEAMSVKAENLTNIILRETDVFLEFSTEGAMNSGIIYGMATQVEGLYRKASKEFSLKTLVLAGGFSELISKYVAIPHILERDIVLKGCWEIFKENFNE
jgi:type III pantothenate kinase